VILEFVQPNIPIPIPQSALKKALEAIEEQDKESSSSSSSESVDTPKFNNSVNINFDEPSQNDPESKN
jgi:hypothetical protein